MPGSEGESGEDGSPGLPGITPPFEMRADGQCRYCNSGGDRGPPGPPGESCFALQQPQMTKAGLRTTWATGTSWREVGRRATRSAWAAWPTGAAW